ncbi:hypothetical protein NFI96_023579 [Prochilodus magdalenae]|nr:hypothetical protein NFI96_023579 [Prochilodus magdalenae]
MFFLRQLKKFHLPQTLMIQFYTAIIESILTASITIWFGSSTSQERPNSSASSGQRSSTTVDTSHLEDGSSRSRLKQSPFNRALQRTQDVASARSAHLTTESRTGQASIDCQTPGHVTRGRTAQRKGKLHADPLHGEDGRPSQGPASSANPNAWVNGGPPPRPDQPARHGYKAQVVYNKCRGTSLQSSLARPCRWMTPESCGNYWSSILCTDCLRLVLRPLY